jgi:diguanylate cyclase (GGDEF)-like protein
MTLHHTQMFRRVNPMSTGDTSKPQGAGNGTSAESPAARWRARANYAERLAGLSQTVLVVDDDPDNRLLLSEILRQQCRVIEASSGAEALEIAFREPRVDLILLDVMMPGMSGYEVLERLRSDVRTADTAVIFVTGQDDENEEEKGLLMGAVDYVFKPIRPAIVRVRLANQLKMIAQRHQMSLLLGRDALTGIANRRSFDEALERIREVSIRSGRAFGLALIDVDFFKQYNDSFGHPAGDLALREIAAVIAQFATAPHQLAARYGGEEFALLLPDATGLAALLDSLRRAVLDLGLKHPTTPWGVVSISAGGIATHAEPDTHADDLLRRADALLYEAKRAGRNRILTRLDSF